eukprot:g59630.t1
MNPSITRTFPVAPSPREKRESKTAANKQLDTDGISPTIIEKLQLAHNLNKHKFCLHVCVELEWHKKIKKSMLTEVGCQFLHVWIRLLLQSSMVVLLLWSWAGVVSSACIPFEWGSTDPWSNYLNSSLNVCFTAAVPSSWSKQTCVILGRFFPENAGWCATWVKVGGTPTACKPFRPVYPDTFSYPLDVPAGQVADFYLYTSVSNEFTSVWIAPITPQGCTIPEPSRKLTPTLRKLLSYRHKEAGA